MSDEQIKKILITSIGGDIAQCIAKILTTDRADIQIIGTDVGDRNAGEFYVNKFIQVPDASDRQYLNAIKKIIEDESIDIFIPISEAEIRESLSLNDKIACKIIHAGASIINIGLDKLETYNALSKIGCDLPWTINSDTGLPDNYPCIFKSRTSSGSKSIIKVFSLEEALFYKNLYQGYIFQELLMPIDQEVTCGVYRTKQGETHVVQILRKLTQGQTSWGKIINEPSINLLCEKVAQCLDLQGSINIQLINTEHGPKIFEINPRFSSTVLMRHLLGFRDLIWSIEELQGKLINFEQPKAGIIMHKVHDVIIQNNV